MTTKSDIIKELKAEYPTLKMGDDENGYSELDSVTYEATIETWADNKLAELTALAEIEIKNAAKSAILAKLGITSEEITALLA
jgi:hypothetical protein